MIKYIYLVYAYVFGRPVFRKLNTLLYHLSLRGLGILNYQGTMSGELNMLRILSAKFLGSPVIFDVGANVGMYSKDIKNSMENSIIYAFEPHPKNFDKLKIIPDINCVNAAVGSVSGESMTLFDYGGDQDGSSHASLYEGVIRRIHHSSSTAEYKIKVISLDQYCEDNSIECIDLLKIDTEGHELDVLKGASRLLREKRIKYIHFEFNEMNLESRVFFRDFVDILNGYSFFRILPHGFLKLDYSSIGSEIFAYQNILAVRDGCVL